MAKAKEKTETVTEEAVEGSVIAPQEVTNEDLELAIHTVAEWHRQKKISFAIVNSGAGIMISQGNAFELEASLNHAHKITEFENGQRLMTLKQAHEARLQATEAE